MMEPTNTDPTALAYQLFLISGNPGYYMLYSDLKRSAEDEESRE